jgi:tetratricopeptide (TPR) repeat protein
MSKRNGVPLSFSLNDIGAKKPKSVAGKTVPPAFQKAEDLEEDEEDPNEPRPAWQAQTNFALLEDARAKVARLKTEGGTLAEDGKLWAGIGRWDEALSLTPGDHELHEMKAQALMLLDEIWPALQCATKAVELSPGWADGQLTLGRAQMGVGEVELASGSFAQAAKLDPENAEIQEDLERCRSLLVECEQKQEQFQCQLVHAEAAGDADGAEVARCFANLRFGGLGGCNCGPSCGEQGKGEDKEQ